MESVKKHKKKYRKQREVRTDPSNCQKPLLLHINFPKTVCIGRSHLFNFHERKEQVSQDKLSISDCREVAMAGSGVMIDFSLSILCKIYINNYPFLNQMTNHVSPFNRWRSNIEVGSGYLEACLLSSDHIYKHAMLSSKARVYISWRQGVKLPEVNRQ